MNALVVEDVHKSFPVADGMAAWIRHRGRIPRREVLRGIDLNVARGELLGLLGPNGAGKTTLLKSLATLLLPDRGRVVVDGIDVAREPLLAKRKIGLCVSEERSFYYRLTARANLEFFGTLYGLRGAPLQRRVNEVAEQVGLTEALDRRFEGFSSGMRQRLTVARALLGDPPIMLLDEPTRAVDPVHAEALRRFIRTVLVGQLGKTVILATNLLEEAWELCDRVAVVNGGKIVALGPPASLDGALQRVERYAITVDRLDAGLVERARAIPGVFVGDAIEANAGFVLSVEIAVGADALTELCRAVSANGVRVRGFTAVEDSPADVFRRVTQDRDADR